MSIIIAALLGMALGFLAVQLYKKWSFEVLETYQYKKVYIYNKFEQENYQVVVYKGEDYGIYIYYWEDEMPEQIPEDARIVEDGYVQEVDNGLLLYVREQGKKCWSWGSLE